MYIDHDVMTVFVVSYIFTILRPFAALSNIELDICRDVIKASMKIFSWHMQKQKTAIIKDYVMAGNQLSHFPGMNGKPVCTYLHLFFPYVLVNFLPFF